MSFSGREGMGSASAMPQIRVGLEALDAVDWDFAGERTNGLTHALHPYPAKFIPQIPATLINALSVPGERVADIFCGSGTTLVEALHAGRAAVGIDANPLACLISAAKCSPLASPEVDALRSVVNRAREMAGRLGSTPLFGASAFKSPASRPVTDKLSFWFDDHIIEELAEILSWCQSLPTEARALALTSFSAIVVAVSRQDSDTRYVRREKKLQPGDAFKRFARTLEANVRAASIDRPSVWPEAQIVQASVLDHPAVGEFDLMVCSPPYPNAFSYHLYHMTRMLWLGMDQPTFKAAEIGSHRKYSSKGAKGATASTFFNEFVNIFSWLRNALLPHRYACFVVGNSTIRGEQINNADLISAAGVAAGFVERRRYSRRLQDTRKAFNPAIGKIKTESVLILQNEAHLP